MIPDAPLGCQSIPRIGLPQIGRKSGKDQYSEATAGIGVPGPDQRQGAEPWSAPEVGVFREGSSLRVLGSLARGLGSHLAEPFYALGQGAEGWRG